MGSSYLPGTQWITIFQSNRENDPFLALIRCQTVSAGMKLAVFCRFEIPVFFGI